MFLIFRPALVTQLALAGTIFIALHEVSTLPRGYFAAAPAWVACLAFSLFLFLLDDFTRYFLHRLLHRWPVLWAFHKLHHSAETLTPLTILRTHPVEGVLFATRSALQGVSIGFFVFLFGNTATLATVFGVNLAVFTFHIIGSNLRHSHVWIAYPSCWNISSSRQPSTRSTIPMITRISIVISVLSCRSGTGLAGHCTCRRMSLAISSSGWTGMADKCTELF